VVCDSIGDSGGRRDPPAPGHYRQPRVSLPARAGANDQAVIKGMGARPVALEELLASADLVSIHCPLAESTRGLVGERELRMMRPEAILVNTSRGAVVDEPALTQAL